MQCNCGKDTRRNICSLHPTPGTREPAIETASVSLTSRIEKRDTEGREGHPEKGRALKWADGRVGATNSEGKSQPVALGMAPYPFPDMPTKREEFEGIM